MFGRALAPLHRTACVRRRSFATAAAAAHDVCIIGGGIVGLATARELVIRFPKLKVIVVEKESSIAQHQSSRNSGVIHAGIYYAPGSLRARLCVEGSKRMYAYCESKRIPAKRVGKLIVAVDPSELPKLNDYYERSVKNNVPGVELIDAKRITEMEPYIRGLRALWSPSTGITNFGLVARHYAQDFTAAGGTVRTGFEVTAIDRAARHSVTVNSGGSNGSVSARYVIACAGGWGDRVSILGGGAPKPVIVPFRGSWFRLKPAARRFVSTNIYPVANPNFPFLGVHFTPTVNGDVLLGPNAALALSRAGYDWRTVNVRDAMEAIATPGLRRLVMNNFGYAAGEVLNEIFPSRTLALLQRYMPTLRAEHLEAGTTSGVRAQALHDDGSLVDDFLFETPPGGNILNVRNAPSPGATSSLAIAEMIVDKAVDLFHASKLIDSNKLNAGATAAITTS